MNLFYNPSLNDLSLLVMHCANHFDSYDIIVDHDGEVIAELSSEKTRKNRFRYKFFFSKLHGKANIGILGAGNLRFLNQLYKNLIFCWENDLTGEVDFNEVSSLQNINVWLEINNIKSNSEDNN